MTTPTCATCRFFLLIMPEDDSGICRLKAPTTVPRFSDGEITSDWPQTYPTDWCGEHQPKQKPRRKA